MIQTFQNVYHFALFCSLLNYPCLFATLDYQYLITLGDSQWGLLAEKLINNITLSKEDVKWRTNKSKRPWLAGVIKEKMCALIDVDNLNILLEKGLDSRQ